MSAAGVMRQTGRERDWGEVGGRGGKEQGEKRMREGEEGAMEVEGGSDLLDVRTELPDFHRLALQLCHLGKVELEGNLLEPVRGGGQSLRKGRSWRWWWWGSLTVSLGLSRSQKPKRVSSDAVLNAP
eukprot:747907-Hanusia_phi.AAC.5